MAVDSFSHSSEDVLKDLDPLSRALLDLSLQRGMEDAEIADVLGTDEESVLEVRVGLLRALAEKVAPEHAEADVPELQAVIAQRVYGEDAPAEEAAVAADLGEEPPAEEAEDDRPTAVDAVPDPEPEPEPVDHAPVAPEPTASESAPAEQRKRRSPLVFLLPLLLVVALAGVILTLTSGGDDSDSPSTPAAPQRPAPDAKPDKPAAADKARAVRLSVIGGGEARGTATRDGNRLKLKLRGLPAAQGGSYQVWLYDSVIDAKSLGSSKEAKIDLDAKLPKNADDYRYVDVSIEPADGNGNHSGRSVLRVPLSKLGDS